MTPDEFREHFRAVTDKAGGAAAWGRENGGVSRQYIFQVLNNERPPSPAILAALGMVEAVNYAPVKKRAPVSPSVVDRTRDRNREDARRELDRQEGGLLDAWARKWGRPLLDGYDRNNVGDLRSHNFPEPDRPAARKRK